MYVEQKQVLKGSHKFHLGFEIYKFGFANAVDDCLMLKFLLCV